MGNTKDEEIDYVIKLKVEENSQITNLELRRHLLSKGFKISLEELAERRDMLERGEMPLDRFFKQGQILDVSTPIFLLGRVERLIIRKTMENPSISDSELVDYLHRHGVRITTDNLAQRKTELQRKLISHKLKQDPQISNLNLRAYLLSQGLEISLEDLTKKKNRDRKQACCSP